MKIFKALALLLMYSSLSLAADLPKQLNAIPLKDGVLTEVANADEIKELDISKGSSFAHARLFAIAESGTCVPESDFICSYRYYLAVLAGEEAPRMAIYNLGEFGEISEAKLVSEKEGTLEYQIVASNYPSFVLERNEVKRITKTYQMRVNFKSLALNGKP